jgi:hypothetical protein
MRLHQWTGGLDNDTIRPVEHISASAGNVWWCASSILWMTDVIALIFVWIAVQRGRG